MNGQLVLQPDPSQAMDAYIGSTIYEDYNFGDDGQLNVGAATLGKTFLVFRTLISFDLAALPSHAVVTGATLTLFHTNEGQLSVSEQFHAYRLTRDNWTEFGVTWKYYDGEHAWTTPGGDYDPVGHDTTTLASIHNDLVFHGLATLANDALEHRSGMLRLLIAGPAVVPEHRFVSLASADSSEESADWPKLVIDYEVPPPELTVADHGDNTGATATIAVTQPDAINTVLVQPFSGELGSGQGWTGAGSRTGEGTLSLALSAGHYFACVSSVYNGHEQVSAVTYFTVTDGLESIHTRCLVAAQARIRLLTLAGVEPQRVIIEKVPVGRNLASGVGLPAIVLSPHRAAMPPTAGTNSCDDVSYHVLVTIFDRDNQEPSLAANLERHFLWRQQIARAFRNQRLPGVPEVINAEVELTEGLHEEAWKRELMTTPLLIRFTSRERRGFG